MLIHIFLCMSMWTFFPRSGLHKFRLHFTRHLFDYDVFRHKRLQIIWPSTFCTHYPHFPPTYAHLCFRLLSTFFGGYRRKMAILILKTLCYNENGTETLTIHRKNGILIMSSITLHSAEGCSITMISDIFVDYYMPRANGEFVKIYLYLLRSMHNTGTQISLSMLADVFSCPENDIRRALNYWDDAGVLSLSYKKDELSSVLFLRWKLQKRNLPHLLRGNSAHRKNQRQNAHASVRRTFFAARKKMQRSHSFSSSASSIWDGR